MDANENEVISQLAVAAIEPRTVGGADYAVIPPEFEFQDLESFHGTPRRKRGAVALHDSESLVAYVQKHKDVDSVIYCDRVGAKFVAVLDAHTAEGPRWGEHRATLTLQRTPEWATWSQSNKRQMAQVPFAEFIEANLPDITKPSGAELLEMCLTLEEKRNITFASAVRLKDGVKQFTYNEESNAAGKHGNVMVNIPERFTIEVAPFEGAPEQALDVLLRYRIKDGSAVFWYEIPRVDDVERAAVKGASELISARTETVMLFGVPG